MKQSGLAKRPWMVMACALFAVVQAHAGLVITPWTHSSGAKVFLVESPGIPMVDVQIDFDAGERRIRADKTGLAQAMASATSDGVQAFGALPALDENALSSAWADLGAAMSASASSDRLSFSLRSLSYPDVLGPAALLAARQIGEPAFPEKLWLRDRPKMLASLKEAQTRPATLAWNAFAPAVYGTHPYGRIQTADHLNAIQSADMQALHAHAVRACDARVSIVGAVNRAQADALVTTLLSRIRTQPCQPQPAVAEVEPLVSGVEKRIAFDSAQAHVLIGQPGIARKSPDFFALLVANHILGGGGFSSRLTEEVREKRGLTYGVSSGFSPALHAGAFTISLQTRPDQAQQAIDVVREVLQRFVADGPTPAELQAAKNNLVGGFALRIDSNRKVLDNVANIAWNDLPLDYLDRWTAHLEAVRLEDIRAALGRSLQPQKMVTVVLGAQ
ncbi:MAG: insulinase family protein [Sulfuritalea sp.]|nr:insulinase family protein [Sulfuritalea sp.]